MSEFFMKNSLGTALKTALGTESIYASHFVQSAFGRLKSLNNAYFHKDINVETISRSEEHVQLNVLPADRENILPKTDISSSDSLKMDNFFWKKVSQYINETVNQKHGFSLPHVVGWEAFDLLHRIGLQSQKSAEQEYIKSGLASPDKKDVDGSTHESTYSGESQNASEEIKKASWDILSHTDSILGGIMLLTSAFSHNGQNSSHIDEKREGNEETGGDNLSGGTQQSMTDISALHKKEEEIKALFTTAESAMEAWALLATSLGRSSFIKSEFEKICFLDNFSSDTQAS